MPVLVFGHVVLMPFCTVTLLSTSCFAEVRAKTSRKPLVETVLPPAVASLVLGLDLGLHVSPVAEDLFELEHLTRPVMLKQDHLYVTVRIHRRQGGAQFADRQRHVLTHP